MWLGGGLAEIVNMIWFWVLPCLGLGAGFGLFIDWLNRIKRRYNA